MKNLLLRWEFVLALLLVAEIAIFGMINPNFLNPMSLIYGTTDFVQIGMVALPLTLVIIAGGIDVSFASTIGLSAIVFGLINYFGGPLPLAIAGAIGIGALVGLFNASVIHFTKLQPLVVTLGSLYLCSGGATVLSGLAGASGFEGIGGFPTAFTSLGYMSLFGLPLQLIIFLALAALMIVLLHATRFGRALFLIGMNDEAARHAGIPVRRLQTITYVLLGAMAALTGLMLSAYFGSARVDLGASTLLPAITATVLGGASIYGGKGSIPGTVLSTFLIGYLQQGLQMAGVSSLISNALAGALLVLVVALRFGGALLRNEISILRRMSVRN